MWSARSFHPKEGSSNLFSRKMSPLPYSGAGPELSQMGVLSVIPWRTLRQFSGQAKSSLIIKNKKKKEEEGEGEEGKKWISGLLNGILYILIEETNEFILNIYGMFEQNIVGLQNLTSTVRRIETCECNFYCPQQTLFLYRI